nr:hypothetical protein [Prevotella fusca]
MKKKTLLLAALLGLGVLNAGAKDFYEFDNVTAETVLKLFLQAKEAGRNYPTLEEFQSIGVSAADIEFIRSHVRRSELVNPDDRLNLSSTRTVRCSCVLLWVMAHRVLMAIRAIHSERLTCGPCGTTPQVSVHGTTDSSRLRAHGLTQLTRTVLV